MYLDNGVDTPVTIRIVTIKPNCFCVYEVSHFDAKVQWYFGLFDFVRFIHEDRKQLATPLQRTRETVETIYQSCHSLANDTRFL